ncbi:MAG: DUF3313 family protein [Candidatus Omnitrophica bacterium]|nr:DUF3313 family protein [Candidatus Omnitrophota bacterium]
MNKIFYLLILVLLLSGCATKMAYLNTQKPPEEVRKDKDDCQVIIDSSDFKDAGLKQNKFNQCMKDKGYNVVSEDKAEEVQGFKELWVKSGTDFKAYEAIFIDRVDVSQVKEKNNNIPGTKVTDTDINNLGDEMLKRFSGILSAVMPVIRDKEEAAGKKVLYVRLKLNNIAQTKVGFNAALQVAGQVSGLPLPGGPAGSFSFECAIADFVTKEKLMVISSETKADKNASLAGLEKFKHWKRAYNIMDYWADHLAALLAKERGQKYKSQIRIKIIDF